MSEKRMHRETLTAKTKPGDGIPGNRMANERPQSEPLRVSYRTAHMKEIEAALSPFWAWRVTYR